MSCKIAVCDDSAADRAYMRDLVGRWAAAGGRSMELAEFESGEQFLFSHGEDALFDILLLDIEMGELDGVALAKRLRSASDTLQIVFTTGYSDYIAEGYEVSALHYLMKPVREEKLFAVLDRAVEKLRKDERVLVFEIGGELVRVPIYQIRFIDVHQNYATIHAAEDYRVKKPLAELQALLDERFHRVGRSAVVNLTMIRRVSKTEIILSTGEVLPLPRGAYEGVNRAIINMG